MLPKSIPKPPKFPGPEQPPLSLRPGILAENIVLPPRTTMKTVSSPRMSPLPPGQTSTQRSPPVDSVRQPSPKFSLPYPDDDQNLIPDIERPENNAVHPSSPPAPPGGMLHSGSSVQRQTSPPASVTPGHVEQAHRHPDFHIQGFPGHNVRPLDSNNGRRRSSGVSPVSASTTGPLSTGPISSASSMSPATASSEGSGRRASGYFPSGAVGSNDGMHRQSTGNLAASRVRPRNQGRRKSSLSMPSQTADAPVGNAPTAGLPKTRPMSMVVPGEAEKRGQSQNMAGLHSIEEHTPVPAALAIGPRSRQSSISSFMSNQPQLQSPGALSPGSQKFKTPEYFPGPGRPVSLPAPSRSSTPASISPRPTVPALQTNLRIAQEASSPESAKKSHKPSLSASLSPKGLREKSRWLTKKLFKGGSSFKVSETKIPDSVILSTSQDPRVQFTPLWQQQESNGPRISHEDPLRSQPPWAMSYPNNAKNSPGLCMDGTRSISETLPDSPQSQTIGSQVQDTTPPPTLNDSPQAQLTVHEFTVGARSGTPVSALTISRNQSDSSRHSNAKLAPPSELGDGVSDQASVSTMDIAEAHTQPVLRPQGPQLIEVRSSASVERSQSPLAKTSMGSQQAKGSSSSDAQVVSPLSVPKKKQRKSVSSVRVPYDDPLAELEAEDASVRQVDTKDTPVQGHRKVSSEVLVNELMNSLLSKDKRLHTSSMTPGKETQSFLAELAVDSLTPRSGETDTSSDRSRTHDEYAVDGTWGLATTDCKENEPRSTHAIGESILSNAVIRDEKWTPAPLSPKSPRSPKSPARNVAPGASQSSTGDSIVGGAGVSPEDAAEMRWKKMPVPDYSGYGWDDNEFA